MSKKLVACFSASGVTAGAAKLLAEVAEADYYPILPAVPYTEADLNWRDLCSRSSVEMRNPSSRPALAEACPDLSAYDVIFVGFPIWWYIAPTIVNTFLEGCDLRGKTIVPFATSGSSDMGGTNAKLRPSCPDSTLLEGRILNHATREDIRKWLDTLPI